MQDGTSFWTVDYDLGQKNGTKMRQTPQKLNYLSFIWVPSIHRVSNRYCKKISENITYSYFKMAVNIFSKLNINHHVIGI